MEGRGSIGREWCTKASTAGDFKDFSSQLKKSQANGELTQRELLKKGGKAKKKSGSEGQARNIGFSFIVIMETRNFGSHHNLKLSWAQPRGETIFHWYHEAVTRGEYSKKRKRGKRV